MQTEEINNPEHYVPLNKEIIETSPDLTQPAPDNPPWNSWTAFGVWMASVVFIVVLPNLFILPYIMKKGIVATDSAQMMELILKDPTAIILSVIAIIPAHILT